MAYDQLANVYLQEVLSLNLPLDDIKQISNKLEDLHRQERSRIDSDPEYASRRFMDTLKHSSNSYEKINAIRHKHATKDHLDYAIQDSDPDVRAAVV